MIFPAYARTKGIQPIMAVSTGGLVTLRFGLGHLLWARPWGSPPGPAGGLRNKGGMMLKSSISKKSNFKRS